MEFLDFLPPLPHHLNLHRAEAAEIVHGGLD
jgi:hypothetical protein